MKNLDEMIKHCEEVAEAEERSAKLHQKPDKGVKGSGKRYLSCLECANEHRQIAEWLKKLQAYEEAKEEIIRTRDSGYMERRFSDVLNYAILIIDKHLKEVNTDEDSD